MAPGKSLRPVYIGVMVVGLLVLAQVVGHSYATFNRGWSLNSLPVYLNLGSLGDYWRGGAITSLRAWNSAGGRSLFSWNSSSQAQGCARNGRNDVFWSSQQCREAWGTITQAVTTSWETASGYHYEADVMFNDGISWDMYSGRLGSTRNEFRRVALHEFGHVLGLDHPDEHGQSQVAIMNSLSGDTDRLQTDDLNGLRFLYGGGGTPDLVVQSLRPSDGTLTARQSFTLSATVRNSGSGPAGSTTLRYYYWQASSSSWVVVGYDSVSSLGAGGSSNESIALSAPSSSGSHWYVACVASVSGEQNTSNCSSNLRVTVSTATVGRPDLVVPTLRASVSPLRPGQSFTLNATVQNRGTATSESTTLQFYYWQASRGAWVVVGSNTVDTLSPSWNSQEQIRLTAPSSTGSHWYTACVEAVIRELNRSNCSSNLQVTVSGTGRGGSNCTSHLGTLSSSTVLRNGAWTGQCQSVHYPYGEYARYYSFTLSRTTTVTMDLTSSTVDTWLALYHGSGMGSTRIEADNNDGSGTNARIVRTLSAGTYTIEATTLRGRVTGSFRLTVAPRDCRLFDCLQQVDKPSPEGVVGDPVAAKGAAMQMNQP